MTWAVTGIQNRLDRLPVSGQWGLVRLWVCSDMGGDMGGDRHTEQTGQTTGKWSVGSGEVTGVQRHGR